MSGASALMKDKGIRHLPVVDARGQLVGVLTDRDLKRASASNATSLDIHELLYLLDKVRIREIMSRSPITVSPQAALQEAASLMVEQKVGCLPVLQGEALTGMVTSTDLLRHLAGR